MKGKKSEGIHLAQAQCGLYNFIIKKRFNLKQSQTLTNFCNLPKS